MQVFASFFWHLKCKSDVMIPLRKLSCSGLLVQHRTIEIDVAANRACEREGCKHILHYCRASVPHHEIKGSRMVFQHVYRPRTRKVTGCNTEVVSHRVLDIALVNRGKHQKGTILHPRLQRLKQVLESIMHCSRMCCRMSRDYPITVPLPSHLHKVLSGSTNLLIWPAGGLQCS